MLEALYIHEGTINSTVFTQFIDTQVATVLQHGEIPILDNALIHKTAEAQRALNNASHGRHTFCSPYSPTLKPIERLFGMVKKYLRDNETVAIGDPLVWINRAFDMFRYGGSRQHEIRPLWNIYFRNHESFLMEA